MHFSHIHFKRILKISRPRFWVYELGPYAIGIAAAGHVMSGAWAWVATLVFFVFFTFPANIFIYGINDIFDYETDRLNPKKNAYESLVEPSERPALFLVIAISCLPFLAYAWFGVSHQAFVWLLAFFFFAGMYSALPIRAKAIPVLDTFFSASHYVATGVFSYIAVATHLGTHWSFSAIVPPIVAGVLWAMAMHAYSAVPDIQADREAHLSTIATLFKQRWTVTLCALFYAVAGTIAVQYLGQVALVLTAVYLVCMGLSVRASEHRLFEIYTYFPIINALCGMIVFFTVLLAPSVSAVH